MCQFGKARPFGIYKSFNNYKGKMMERTTNERTVVKITIPTRNQLKLQAVKNNMTMMDYIQYLLDLHKGQ